jgi:adenosylmethionine-8-amino-7-oxononanoate aminotransferase
VDATQLRARFVEKGCWIKPFSDIVYLAPPLVIGEDDLSHLTRTIFDILNRG